MSNSSPVSVRAHYLEYEREEGVEEAQADGEGQQQNTVVTVPHQLVEIVHHTVATASISTVFILRIRNSMSLFCNLRTNQCNSLIKIQ